MVTVETYFLWLMIYSIIGWIYETILCSVEGRRFVNRGFLNGPYCPIYGCGALLDILILGKIESPGLLFFLGALVTCSLEYLTSYLMEKMFHARWWDYSHMRFHINGRVCLLGAVVFGAFSVVLIKVLHPFVVHCTSLLPPVWFHCIVAVLFAGFLADNIVTFAGMADFREKLALLVEEYEKLRTVGKQEVAERRRAMRERFSAQQRRMIDAFPKLRHSLDQFKALRDRKK